MQLGALLAAYLGFPQSIFTLYLAAFLLTVLERDTPFLSENSTFVKLASEASA